MGNPGYRVVLTGELLPGFDPEGAIAGMARLFDRPPGKMRQALDLGHQPVNQLYSADDAFQIQNRLERLGVRSRIERSSVQPSKATGRNSAAVDPGKMQCPACGQVQIVSSTCAACGINFEDYNRLRREGRLPVVPPASPPPETNQERHLSSWAQAAHQFEDECEPREDDYLALFVGPRHVTNYLPVFARYREGDRLKFAFGWNWGAVFSPFLWAMQRKLWLWAMTMFLTEILIPATLIVLGTRPGMPLPLAMIGGGLLVVNRIVWPALANYLYYRHARASIRRLERMSATNIHEIDVVEAGGVSLAGGFIGLCMAVVSVLVCWNLIDSLGIGKTAFERGEYFSPAQQQNRPWQAPSYRSRSTVAQPSTLTGPSLDQTASRRTSGTAPQVSARTQGEIKSTSAATSPAKPNATVSNGTKQNKWVLTRRKLQSLGHSINRWLTSGESKSVDPMSVTSSKLRQALALDEADMADAWGSEIQYIPNANGYRLISAGPDELFGTPDDLQFAKVLQR